MTTAEFRALAFRSPFVPITIRTADGRDYRVAARELMWLPPGTDTVYVASGGHLAYLAIPQIVAIVPEGPPITIEVQVRLRVVALPEPAGGYSILVPALPGCCTDAMTLDEVQANVVEAAEGWLAAVYDRDRDEAIRVARGESPRAGEKTGPRVPLRSSPRAGPESP